MFFRVDLDVCPVVVLCLTVSLLRPGSTCLLERYRLSIPSSLIGSNIFQSTFSPGFQVSLSALFCLMLNIHKQIGFLDRWLNGSVWILYCGNDTAPVSVFGSVGMLSLDYRSTLLKPLLELKSLRFALFYNAFENLKIIKL